MPGPMPSALRRLPFREAVAALRAAEKTHKLSPSVSGLALSFVAKNSEPGPREFLRTVAPRIAYANPAVPFIVDRIRDPRSKSKDPNSPDAGAVWEGGQQPGPSMVVSFHTRPSQTIPLRHLSSEQIWKQLASVAGEGDLGQVGAPEAAAEPSSTPA